MRGCDPVWGIIGSGNISQDFYLALKKNGSNVKFISASSTEKAEVFAKANEIPFFGLFDTLLSDKDVNIVYVGAIHPFHYEYAKRALDAGKSVICEKPMTMNSFYTESLISLAREKDLFLLEGMWTRFFPVHQKVKKLLQTGELGRVDTVTADFSFPASEDIKRLWDRSLGGGSLLDIGIYPLAWVTSVLGFSKEEQPIVRATGELVNGVDSSCAISLLFPSGTSATVSCSLKCYSPERTVISCEKGYIEIENAHTPEIAKVTIKDGRGGGRIKVIHEQVSRYKLDEKQTKFPLSEGFIYEVQAVEECLKKGVTETIEMPLDETLYIAKIMDSVKTQIGVVYDEDKECIEMAH